MPKEIIEGFAYLKKAAAYANDLGVLPIEKRDALQPFAMKY
jgi:fumarate hydratase class II